MAWRCTKCFQEWQGYGNTCNDCIRREQLEQQNNIMLEQSRQAERQQYRQNTYYDSQANQHWDLYRNNPVYQKMVDAQKVIDSEEKQQQKIYYKRLEKEANLFETLNCIIWCFIIYFVDLYLFKGFFCRTLWALITGIFEMCLVLIKTVFFGN